MVIYLSNPLLVVTKNANGKMGRGLDLRVGMENERTFHGVRDKPTTTQCPLGGNGWWMGAYGDYSRALKIPGPTNTPLCLPRPLCGLVSPRGEKLVEMAGERVGGKWCCRPGKIGLVLRCWKVYERCLRIRGDPVGGLVVGTGNLRCAPL